MGKTDPEVWETMMRSEAVRTFARQRLTETQYRRVALIYGFHGAALSMRAVAKREHVHHHAVQQSHESALRRLRTDARLLLLWLTVWM